MNTETRVEDYDFEIDPNIAKTWIQKFYYPYQRPLGKRQVVTLHDAMISDEFLQNTVISFAQLPNGKRYIIDGNHRLNAIIDSGTKQLFTVCVYSVNNIEEVADLYIKFDKHKRRTQFDTVCAYNVSEEFDLPKDFLNRAFGAIGLILNGFKKEWIPSEKEKINGIRLYKNGVESYYSAFKGSKQLIRKSLLRTAVMSIGIYTCEYNPALAVGFWKTIAEDDGLINKTPEKQLADFLKFSRMSGGQVIKGVTLTYIINYSAYCWNQFFLKKNATLKLPNDFVFTILGTPYTSQQNIINR